MLRHVRYLVGRKFLAHENEKIPQSVGLGQTNAAGFQ